MNGILSRQLALDYCCTNSDVTDGCNHFNVFRPLEGRRRFDENECFLKIAAVNNKLLCTGREDIIAELEKRLHSLDGRWFMEAGPMLRLNEIIAGCGWRIRQVHLFYIAEHATVANIPDVETVWYDKDEILQFEDDDRFDEAFAFAADAPDVLGAAALKDGVIVGMAGASADSPFMWQIGINVMPGAEGQGIGAYLVSILKNEVLSRGVLPYYGTALSHTVSARVALRAGFLPAWAELITERIADTEEQS